MVRDDPPDVCVIKRKNKQTMQCVLHRDNTPASFTLLFVFIPLLAKHD